jgi:hypothetical protein
VFGQILKDSKEKISTDDKATAKGNILFVVHALTEDAGGKGNKQQSDKPHHPAFIAQPVRKQSGKDHHERTSKGIEKMP